MANPSDLIFLIEASLWPGHPHYEAPKPDEWTCYKQAELIFSAASVMGCLPSPTTVQANVDSDVSPDFGSFDRLDLEDGRYYLVTAFADLIIECQRLELKIIKSCSEVNWW